MQKARTSIWKSWTDHKNPKRCRLLERSNILSFSVCGSICHFGFLLLRTFSRFVIFRLWGAKSALHGAMWINH